MDSRIISQNEFDVLFYEELTQNQLNHIFNIIFILSKYMLLTTEMLMQLYQAKYNEKMGLSYLKRAVKEKLVVEYQYNLNEKSEQKVYYYALKSGIFNYLRQNRIPYLKMPPYAAYEEKSRILTFNQFIIAKGYAPNVKIPLDLKLRFFAAKPNIICYYPNLITEREIKLELENRKLDVNVLFMPIELARIDIGKHTRTVNPRIWIDPGGELMPRKKCGSLVYQLNERLKSLQRFGQSKHAAKNTYRREQTAKGEKWNPAFANGIFSYKTYNAYKQTAMEFGAWLKQEHSEIKTLDAVKKEHAVEYLQSRQTQGKSAYTISKDMSAINKLFNTGICKKDAGLKTRSYKDVTRSRAERPNDKKYNPKNYAKQITFAKATGCRRESIVGGQYQVKPCSVWKDPKGNMFVSLIEKGGKFRNAPVLEKYKADIERIIPNIAIRTPHQSIAIEEFNFKELYRSGQNVIFNKYTKKIDNHAFRAEYARARYEELLQQKREQDEEISKNYRGYDMECLRQVSNNLGHNRLSVVVEHYMR